MMLTRRKRFFDDIIANAAASKTLWPFFNEEDFLELGFNAIS